MEGHVNVTVVSRSRYVGGEDVLVFAGAGLLRREENNWHLRYSAKSDSGESMGSDILLHDEGATVRNITGGYTLQLTPKTVTQSRIPTQLGNIGVEVTTHRLDWKLDAAPGQINMDYTLMALGQTLSEVQLTIHLTEQRGEK
ncbi:MAG: DUF1934 domain-containing protein [Oscillospiraceae bacterium]|nr:DUF1934 domain-containing protein [Oscillospiraceae bacterium]